jgi:hypothetical protein
MECRGSGFPCSRREAHLASSLQPERWQTFLRPFEERELETQIEIALYRHQTERKLRQKNLELKSSNRTMVDRELRMIELKSEVDALCVKLGQPLRYGYAPPSGKV